MEATEAKGEEVGVGVEGWVVAGHQPLTFQAAGVLNVGDGLSGGTKVSLALRLFCSSERHRFHLVAGGLMVWDSVPQLEGWRDRTLEKED